MSLGGDPIADEITVYVSLGRTGSGTPPYSFPSAQIYMKADEWEKRIPLGGVAPIDACWVNIRVRICAWPLHEHPEQPEPPA
jgi:hypothetical protein